MAGIGIGISPIFQRGGGVSAPALPTGLTLTLISGGVKIDWTSDVANQTEIWAQSDGGTSALLTTKNAGVVTHNDTVSPVDLRYYKIRAKNGTDYSAFTAEVSIAMIGADVLAGKGTFSNPAVWNLDSSWTINAGKANYDNVTTNAITTNNPTPVIIAGTTYLFQLQVSNLSAGVEAKLQIYDWGYVDLGGYTQANNTTLSFVWVAAFNAIGIRIYGYNSSSGTFSIDNVTVKEILFP